LVSQHLENISREAVKNYEEQRLQKARVRAIRGKCVHIRTSSEMFAFKKTRGNKARRVNTLSRRMASCDFFVRPGAFAVGAFFAPGADVKKREIMSEWKIYKTFDFGVRNLIWQNLAPKRSRPLCGWEPRHGPGNRPQLQGKRMAGDRGNRAG